MTLWAHGAAVLCYLLAAGLGWARLRAVPWVLGAGVALHSVGFVGLHFVDPPIPLESTAAAVSLMGWLVAAAYLVGLRLAGVAAVAPWVASAAALLTLGASIALRLGPPPVASDTGALPHAHVLLGAAGLGILGLSSLAGAGYLAKERRLKAKRDAGFELPSLESLDRLGYLGLAFGYPLLTLAVVTGYLWLIGTEESLWTQHGVLSTIGWIVYLVPVAQRLVRGDRGARTARTVVVGFLILGLSYVGVRVLELAP